MIIKTGAPKDSMNQVSQSTNSKHINIMRKKSATSVPNHPHVVEGSGYILNKRKLGWVWVLTIFLRELPIN